MLGKKKKRKDKKKKHEQTQYLTAQKSAMVNGVGNAVEKRKKEID